jgi:hypothetical protein
MDERTEKSHLAAAGPEEQADRSTDKPKIAPGEIGALDEDATPEQISRGDATRVTKLVWDEYDPSQD